MIKFRYRIIFFIIIFGLVTILSCIFSPHTSSQNLFVSDNEAIIHWDSGYGLNEFQKKIINKSAKAENINDHILYSAYFFTALQWPQAIKINSKLPTLRAFMKREDTFEEITLVRKPAIGDFEYTAEFSAPIAQRRFTTTIFFILGLTLVSVVFSEIIFFVFENAMYWFKEGNYYSRNLLYLAVSMIALKMTSLYQSYPFNSNVFNAFGTIMNFESNVFSPSDSILLQVIWSLFYQVLSRPYFINIMQLSIFLFSILIFAKKILKIGIPIGFPVLASLFLLFSPLSIVYSAFLEKNITNGFVNCILIMFTFIYLFQKDSPTLKECIFLSLSVALSVAVRFDNIIFSFLLTVPVFLRLPKPLTYYMFALTISLVVFCSVGLERIYGTPDWRASYITISTISTMSDMLFKNKNIFLNERELITTNKVLELDALKKNNYNDSINIFSALKNTTPENHQNYLKVYIRTAILNPTLFLSSRFKLFIDLIKNYRGTWDYNASTNARLRQLALSYRFIPVEKLNSAVPVGISSRKIILSMAGRKWTTLYPELFTVIFAIILLPMAPVSGFLALCLFIRVTTVFFLAPVSSFFYLFDVYLAGGFLFFALAYELFYRWKHKTILKYPVLAFRMTQQILGNSARKISS